MNWKPIDTAPHMQEVLVYYPLERNTKIGEIIKAKYVDRYAIESMEDESEYDEKTDEYYIPEGWYEVIENWDEYRLVRLYPENIPTHWMPLPSYPIEI